MIKYRMVLLKTLVFTHTKKKTIKLKTKLHASNSRWIKAYGCDLDKKVYKYKHGLQILQTSIGLLVLRGITGLLELTRRTILEFRGLLE